ncbi:hypothetical protein CSAL01_12994, partial [Colletotrichum salicis]
MVDLTLGRGIIYMPLFSQLLGTTPIDGEQDVLAVSSLSLPLWARLFTKEITILPCINAVTCRASAYDQQTDGPRPGETTTSIRPFHITPDSRHYMKETLPECIHLQTSEGIGGPLGWRNLPDVKNQECWKCITSTLRNPGPHPTDNIYIHALNVVDCELARIFNNGRMHETLVEMARDVGFDAHKCCDPSRSMVQIKIEPPRVPWQMNSADEHTIDDRAAITSRRFDLDKLNYAAVSELLLEQQALKEKREAPAARTTPNSAVGRYQGGSVGIGGGWHRHASPSSFGGPITEPKTSTKATAVDGNVRFRLQLNKPSSLTEESTVSRRMSSSRRPMTDLFDQAEPWMLNDPSSTLVINGVIVQQGQADGGVPKERTTAAARPESRSATRTPSRGGLSGFQNPFNKPPAEAPVNTQPTTEQQALRESSSALSGSQPHAL